MRNPQHSDIPQGSPLLVILFLITPNQINLYLEKKPFSTILISVFSISKVSQDRFILEFSKPRSKSSRFALAFKKMCSRYWDYSLLGFNIESISIKRQTLQLNLHCKNKSLCFASSSYTTNILEIYTFQWLPHVSYHF